MGVNFNVVARDVTDLIGFGPLVSVSEFARARPTEVLLKIEGLSPGGSLKDKTALGLIRSKEQRGELGPGGTVVVSTSGNLGISLGMICAKKKYGLVCVVDPKVPRLNFNIYRSFGAIIDMVTVPDAAGGFQQPRVARAKALAANNEDYVYLDQYDDPVCQQIHYETTGPELWEASGGQVDVVVGTVSTGGHLCGTVRFLKERNPGLVAIGVEPAGSAIFSGTPHPYLQNGTGLAFRPGNYDGSLIDVELKVSDHDAFRTVRALARQEGIMLGGSSGGAVWAAVREAQRRHGGVVVALCPDRGFRYLDTVYSDEWAASHE
ncbi:MAG: PLP-dependent cysteine synthase family protein [Gammaproteobacteria bacterium]